MVRLILSNFKCHRSKSLDFPACGFCVLNGKNEAGKTSIIDAIVFALYGKQKNGYRIITWGETECSVQLWIRGMHITRTVHKTKPAKIVVIHDKNTYRAKHANQVIAEVMGMDRDQFVNSCLVHQNYVGSSNSIVSQTPTEQLRIIESLVGKEDIQINREDLRNKTKRTKEKLDEARGKVEGLSQYIDPENPPEKDDSIEEKILHIAKKRSKVEKKQNEYARNLESQIKMQKKIERMKNAKSERDGQMKLVQKQIESIDATLDSVKVWEEKKVYAAKKVEAIQVWDHYRQVKKEKETYLEEDAKRIAAEIKSRTEEYESLGGDDMYESLSEYENISRTRIAEILQRVELAKQTRSQLKGLTKDKKEICRMIQYVDREPAFVEDNWDEIYKTWQSQIDQEIEKVKSDIQLSKAETLTCPGCKKNLCLLEGKLVSQRATTPKDSSYMELKLEELNKELNHLDKMDKKYRYIQERIQGLDSGLLSYQCPYEGDMTEKKDLLENLKALREENQFIDGPRVPDYLNDRLKEARQKCKNVKEPEESLDVWKKKLEKYRARHDQELHDYQRKVSLERDLNKLEKKKVQDVHENYIDDIEKSRERVEFYRTMYQKLVEKQQNLEKSREGWARWIDYQEAEEGKVFMEMQLVHRNRILHSYEKSRFEVIERRIIEINKRSQHYMRKVPLANAHDVSIRINRDGKKTKLYTEFRVNQHACSKLNVAGGVLQVAELAFILGVVSVMNSPIMLLDECTNSLAADIVPYAYDLLRDEAKYRLIIATTHDMAKGNFSHVIELDS